MPDDTLENLHFHFKNLFKGEEEKIILASLKDPISSTLSLAEFGLDMGLMYAHKFGIPKGIKEMCEGNGTEEIPREVQRSNLSRLPIPSLESLSLARRPTKQKNHHRFSLKGLRGSRKTQASEEIQQK